MTEPVTTRPHRPVPAADRSWAGPVAALALTVTSLTASPPEAPASTTAAAVRAWVTAHEDTLKLQGALTALAALSVLVLAAHLRALMRAGEPGGPLPDVAFGSGVLCAGWLLLASAAGSVAAYDVERLDDGMLLVHHGFVGLADMVGSSALVFKAALLLAVSWAALRTGFLPRWLAWAGLCLGVLTAGGLVGAVSDGVLAGALFYAGLFAFALWPLPVGVVLARRWLRARRG